MTRVRIIGIGSAAGDDRAGWLVVERLDRIGMPGCETVALDRPGLALLHYFADADAVILIDAMRGGGAPGSVRRFTLDDLLSLPATSTVSVHGLGIVEALWLAERLDCLPPRLWLYAIEAGAVDAQSPAGAVVLESIERVAALIAAELSKS